MTAMVRFRANDNTYAIPVSAALGVRPVVGLVQLPSQRNDVVGVLPGEPALSVIALLGATGDHILVVTTPDQDFGLLVDQVTDVCHIDDKLIQPAPAGQDRELVLGMVEHGGEMVLLADPIALGARL